MRLLEDIHDALTRCRVAWRGLDVPSFLSQQSAAEQRVGAALDRNPVWISPEWTFSPIALKDLLLMQDERSRDVTDMLAQTSRWHATHAARRDRYGLPDASALSFSYRATPFAGGCRFCAEADREHWVYLVSRNPLPVRYALDFTYVPHTVFNEQLQIDFGMDSLANRHRFVLKFNEKVFFQVIAQGFFLTKSAPVPYSLPLHEPCDVRLEVVDNCFALTLNGTRVLAYRDRSYVPHPAHLAVLGWNGATKERPLQTLDFEIGDMRLGL